MSTRRSFLASAVGFFAAPAIVRASSIMPVSAMDYLEMAPLKIEGATIQFDYASSNHAWFLLGSGRFETEPDISWTGTLGRFRLKRRWDGYGVVNFQDGWKAA